jgi:L-ascorbate metabolism protein UlaG (beta-lactamase superfamily)
MAQNDPNKIVEPNDPNASWVDGDYHLKSQAGRWQPKTQSWVLDPVTSLCIDAGRLTDPVGLEPFPNGGIINMGAYGGTIQASKSYFGGPPCETIIAGDLNGDCKVDFRDFQLLGLHWLGDYREKLHVQWFGQAAVKIWTSTVVIYVDPYKLTTSPQDATLLLITHSHSDHYSPTDIARVSTSATQLIGPSSVITAAGKGTLILPGQTIDIGSVRITAVAAYNSNHPKSNNWVGFIIEILGKRVFCAGDTSLTTELKAVVGMDVAFLPIDGVYNMGPTVAAEATTYMQPKLAIPYHVGSADPQTFAKLAACPVKIMTVGEEMIIP